MGDAADDMFDLELSESNKEPCPHHPWVLVDPYWGCSECEYEEEPES